MGNYFLDNEIPDVNLSEDKNKNIYSFESFKKSNKPESGNSKDFYEETLKDLRKREVSQLKEVFSLSPSLGNGNTEEDIRECIKALREKIISKKDIEILKSLKPYFRETDFEDFDVNKIYNEDDFQDFQDIVERYIVEAVIDNANKKSITNVQQTKISGKVVLSKEDLASNLKSQLDKLFEGGSKKLKESFNDVWSASFSKIKNLENKNDSSEGDINLIARHFGFSDTNNQDDLNYKKYRRSSLQGALGELQAAIIITYLTRIQTGHGKYIAAVQGVDTDKSSGEQLRADVMLRDTIEKDGKYQIFFGTQVKAYAPSGNNRMGVIQAITSNSHFKRIVDQLPKDNKSREGFVNDLRLNFEEFMSTVLDPKVEYINAKSYKEEEYWPLAAANFQLNEESVDTNLFYFISGEYLVPVSFFFSDEVSSAKVNLSFNSSRPHNFVVIVKDKVKELPKEDTAKINKNTLPDNSKEMNNKQNLYKKDYQLIAKDKNHAKEIFKLAIAKAYEKDVSTHVQLRGRYSVEGRASNLQAYSIFPKNEKNGVIKI